MNRSKQLLRMERALQTGHREDLHWALRWVRVSRKSETRKSQLRTWTQREKSILAALANSELVYRVVDINATLAFISSFNGRAEQFRMMLTDDMNDAMGLNLAVLSDSIKAKGWLPNGFEQGEGYRVYSYTEPATPLE